MSNIWSRLINLAGNVTGTLGATHGGTGQSAYTTGDTLYSSATNVLSKLAAGTIGQVHRQGSTVPAWAWPDIVTATSSSYNAASFTSDGTTVLNVTTGSNTITVTLPTAASPNVGRRITIKKVDTGAATGKITIATTSAQTVDGWTTTDIGVGTACDGAFITVVSDGSNWSVIGCGGEIYDDSFATGYTASQSSTSMITRTLPAGTWRLEVSGWSLTAGASTGSNWFYDLYVNAASSGFLGQDQIAMSTALTASQNLPVGQMMEVTSSTSTIAIILKGSLTRASGTCYLYANMIYTRIK